VNAPDAWWRRGVLYEIYPRSFRDRSGDGVGDIAGIIEKLDYLQWLGVDGIWLNPITRSPDRDFGYDVSDYRSVHPAFGTLADVDELIAAAADRSIRILLDIVPSHTSSQHPWFLDARSSKASRYRDYYVWRPPGPGGRPPTSWQSSFRGSAWSFDSRTAEYYLHTFLPEQPQLNWWNPRVRDEFETILRFWFDRGIAGVRIDAVQALVYDPAFRDEPGGRGNHPYTHDVLRAWRRLADSYDPPRLLFGETWFRSLAQMAEYYGSGSNELDLAWNVPFLQAAFNARSLRDVIERTMAAIPDAAWPVWAMSTHDFEGRFADRWCAGDADRIRCALLMLLTIRGTPILYYGDEIGMTAPPPQCFSDRRLDDAKEQSRDASRTPMRWDRSRHAGFTSAQTPWLPVGEPSAADVSSQSADRASILWLVRDLIALRRGVPALASGSMTFVDAPDDVLAWRRDDVLVAINLGGTPQAISATGRIVISTDRSRDGFEVAGAADLPPRHGIVVQRI
jgi:alpha-glucosidase